MKKLLVCLIFAFAAAQTAVAQSGPQASAVAAAMQAIAEEDWDKASALVGSSGQIARDVIEWQRLRAGEGEFDEYIEFLARRADWPGLPLMIKNGEPNIPDGANADKVVAYFSGQAPRTGTGALRLAAAFRKKGKTTDGENEIIRAWRSLSLSEAEETAFLSNYRALLANYHRGRQDMLLWRGLSTEAARLNGLVGSAYKALTQARIGLSQKKNGVTALINAVPRSLSDDPGLAYARMEWRMRNGQTAGAATLMLARSTSAKSLGDPSAWASRRRFLARQMMREGKPQMAYDLASKHFLDSGFSRNDLEWLSGFIALTDLNDPALALRHFQRFRAAVNGPITLGRAGYWEGRAYEALGQSEAARAAYAFGAEFQTSFYGQLAAEKVGLAMDPALTGRETYPDFSASPHSESSVFQAALLLGAAGEPLLFTRFMRKLAEDLSRDERGALAQQALDMNQTYAAVYLAKYAAQSGDILSRPYFPLTEISSPGDRVPEELVLAIIRRESEFYPFSTSPAGALGLMQLMPDTGKEMANKLQLPFNADRLISDPAFNTTLGTAYLEELISEFDAYAPFVAAGYNAGPSRARRWLKELGDPRRSTEAAVDWIEHIPFRETRNYVKRVMESLAIYRARLSGETSPLRLSRELTGG